MVKNKLLLTLAVIISIASPAFAQSFDVGWITGTIMIGDTGPMSGGTVVFFKDSERPVPDHNRYFRVPDVAADLDSKGKFRIALPTGKYYMGAFKKISGDKVGPPENGDLFYMSQNAAGNPQTFVVEKNQSLNLGILSNVNTFKRTVAKDASGITGIVRNINGKPVKGAIVSAHITGTMTGHPLFTSYKTGDKGEYFISVHTGGSYYLRVRDVYGGGPPVPGAIMGGFGTEKPAPVKVIKGAITKDIDITASRHFSRGPGGRKR